MKIALVQMDVAHGQPTENKKHVKENVGKGPLAKILMSLCSLKCGIQAML